MCSRLLVQPLIGRPVVICAYMTLCGSLRDERRRVRYTRILIFVIDELSRIRHLIGF